jgi:16S rRNA C1402 N4-methylase RsmH
MVVLALAYTCVVAVAQEQDGPLDLRFDQTKGQSAHDWLVSVDRAELVRVLTLYGDGTDTEAVAQRVADAICIRRVGPEGLPTRVATQATLRTHHDSRFTPRTKLIVKGPRESGL